MRRGPESDDGSRHARCALVVAFVATALIALPARAWQQYSTSQGEPMRWSKRALAQGIPYSIDERGLPEGQPLLPQFEAAVQAAFNAWQQVSCEPCDLGEVATLCQDQLCGPRPLGVTFNYLGLRPPQGLGLNCLLWGDGGRCTDAEPNGNQVLVVDEPDRWPFSHMVVAMTLISALPKDGLIADADIALNAGMFPFCDQDCKALQPGIRPVLLHEVGHFLGLDHSLDKGAVMYGQADVLGGAALTLTMDDVLGTCSVYDHQPDASACEPTAEGEVPSEGGCCSATGAGTPGQRNTALASLLVALLWLAIGRRYEMGRSGQDDASAA